MGADISPRRSCLSSNGGRETGGGVAALLEGSGPFRKEGVTHGLPLRAAISRAAGERLGFLNADLGAVRLSGPVSNQRHSKAKVPVISSGLIKKDLDRLVDCRVPVPIEGQANAETRGLG